jgi:hypothetical protein
VAFFLIANYFFSTNIQPELAWKKIGIAGLILGFINYLVK